MKNILKITFNNKSGFSLLEIIIVITLISIMSLVILPRYTNLFNTKKKNFIILTSLIAATFDDSFLKDKTNYLTIHLFEPGEEKDDDKEEKNSVFRRNNGVSVLNFTNQQFVDNKRKILKHRSFPDSFKFEKVILASGEEITSGSVMIPFYPQGYSDNIIIHILVDDEDKWSIRITKHMKEPEVIPDYISIDNDYM